VTGLQSRRASQLMRSNTNHRVRVRASRTNRVFWGVTNKPLDERSASRHVFPRSLVVPQQDLLRPQAEWRPWQWARWWTPCCPYGSARCRRHCRRILSGKAGRDICGKTRQQATLYGWTHGIKGQTALQQLTAPSMTLSTGRKTKAHKTEKLMNSHKQLKTLPIDMYCVFVCLE